MKVIPLTRGFEALVENLVKYVPLTLYVASIFGANWALITFGLVPVGFGLLAPAGVTFAGLAFTFRDLTQDQLGRRWTFGAILIGALFSGFLSGPLAIASGIAFLVSETADLAVYTPLRERRWLWAVGLSNLVGLVIDSVLFLMIAFRSLDFLWGQVVGKLEMTILAVVVLWGWRTIVVPQRRHQSVGVAHSAAVGGLDVES